jgi:hypothetical protein
MITIFIVLAGRSAATEFRQRERKVVMQIMNETPDENALTIDKSASALGLHEFSLLSRIQAGEIKCTRVRSGEMTIPESELERLARSPMRTLAVPIQDREAKLSDERLGIGWSDGLKRDGVSLSYRVPGYVGGFTETEINGYRAASNLSP